MIAFRLRILVEKVIRQRTYYLCEVLGLICFSKRIAKHVKAYFSSPQPVFCVLSVFRDYERNLRLRRK